MFSQYSNPQFEVEPVEVTSPDGKSTIYPDLSLRTFEVDMAYINGTIGTSLQAKEVCLLNQKLTAVYISSKMLAYDRIIVPQWKAALLQKFMSCKISGCHCCVPVLDYK